MLARKLSISGGLFVLFTMLLLVLLGNPLDKILRKYVKNNEKIIFILGMCTIILMARQLSLWIAPTIEGYLSLMIDLFFGG